MAGGWKEKKRQELVEKGTNHQTEWGDWEHPGVGTSGADALLRGAWQHIAKSRQEARQKRRFNRGNEDELEEKYRNTFL